VDTGPIFITLDTRLPQKQLGNRKVKWVHTWDQLIAYVRYLCLKTKTSVLGMAGLYSQEELEGMNKAFLFPADRMAITPSTTQIMLHRQQIPKGYHIII